MDELHKSPTNISVSIVFYDPSFDELRQTVNNLKKLKSLKNYHFTFYLIDNHSQKRKLKRSAFKSVENNVNFIFLKHNVGFGQGHNKVLTQLHSQYHIVMNPDIAIGNLRGFIRAINYLDRHHDVVLLSPLVRDKKSGEVQYLNRQEPSVLDLMIRFLGPWALPRRQAWFTKRMSGYDHIQDEVNATGSFMILRTSTFEQIKGFDSRFFMYFEDTDLTKRLLQHGRVQIFPDLTVFHGWKRENHTLKGIWPMIRSMIQYFNKWGWKWS